MSRIGNYPDDDLISWFALSPELGGAINKFQQAVYHKSRLPLRVREIARMAIALDNECAVCENTRFGEGPGGKQRQEQPDRTTRAGPARKSCKPGLHGSLPDPAGAAWAPLLVGANTSNYFRQM